MTSATDRLRALLVERGVEYKANDIMGLSETCWGSTYAFQLSPDSALMMRVTPEQAVEATLGRGTCHVKAAKKVGGSFGFSLSCGHSMVNPFNDHPDYCPWCGRKVEA